MIVDVLFGGLLFLLRGLLMLLPVDKLNLDLSPLKTMGEWFGSAAAPIDLPFLLIIIATWMTVKGGIITVRSSVWVYKRVRGG